jgi:hypothetical protein
MKKRLLALAAPFALAASFTPLTHADENLLGYTAGAETLPQGASEAYVWITHHGDKRRGSYARQNMRFEYEYGVSDTLSMAGYLNGYRHDYDCGADGCAGPLSDPEILGSKRSFRMSGVALEAKKMLLSPFKDPVGLALYGEISYDTVDAITGEKGQGWELEGKVIFQKPFLDDQLSWVTNLEIEAESWKPKGGKTEYAIAPRLRTGVSYRFAPNWFIGAEGWIDAEILNPPEGSWEFDHWDMFAGPSLHYGGKRWWATLTYARQLAGSDESDGNSTGLHLADHEKYEIRLKLGYNF